MRFSEIFFNVTDDDDDDIEFIEKISTQHTR